MRILLTGGAGFIGSNIAERLVEDERITEVRVLDNLSSGSRQNILNLIKHPKFAFMWGDIREYNTCLDACRDIDLVCHQAALGSVPRSIQFPLTSNNVNITGTLNIFVAAKDSGIKRVVYASSSSTYGDNNSEIKKEEQIGSPISPYAVTKLVNEYYAKVFSELYNMSFIGLRYFNVFGPKQDPRGQYAAVIPLFIQAILTRQQPIIYGDGQQSRDFTYIENVVQANIKALFESDHLQGHHVFNIACNNSVTILELFNKLCLLHNCNLSPIFRSKRIGDVKHSLACIDRARKLLNYAPKVDIESGLKMTLEWFLKHPDYLE